jgi:CDP-6-deoxy-D-xylo-4-hexulose-3-dehydrase
LQFFEKYPQSNPSWFGFLMTCKENSSFTRNDFAMHLEQNLIQTRNLFAGNILKHPCFDSLVENVDYRVAGSLENTNYIMNNSLWIGLYPGMGKEKLDYMIKVIRNYVLSFRK